MSNYNPYTKRQTMIAPDYEVYRYRSTYMNEVELHHHDFYEIYLLLRGRVEYIVENQLYRVRPGDWMLCSPLELHQARIATDADAYERIVLWIARPYLEGLSTPRTSLTRCFDTTVPGHTNLLRLPGATGAPLRTTVDKLCALKADKAYGSDLLAQSALVELLVGLNRAAAERGDARPTGTSDQVVDAVLHYINEHYSEALTLDQLSEKFFISKYHLLRKFDAQVGTTVHRYILQKRLLNAKQLLAGGVPPNEVCQYCGFGDYANFYRAFRAEYNQTPREFCESAFGGEPVYLYENRGRLSAEQIVEKHKRLRAYCEGHGYEPEGSLSISVPMGRCGVELENMTGYCKSRGITRILVDRLQDIGKTDDEISRTAGALCAHGFEVEVAGSGQVFSTANEDALPEEQGRQGLTMGGI